MNAVRILRAVALSCALLVHPAIAEQGTIVGPVAGPKTMTEVMTAVNAALLAIQSCNSGSSAPANGVSGLPTNNQCWADTTSNPILYKRYDGASWVTFGALNTATHVWTPYRNGSPIAAVATTSSAADLTTGTLPAARLPAPTVSTLGGVQSKTCSASQWLTEITTSGVPNCAQPNFTDLAGAASLAQLPAFSGMSAAAAAADADTFPTNQGAGNLKQTFAAVKTWIKAWIVKADVGLGNVDNTSDATKWGATKTLLNTTFNCGSTGNVCTVRLASDITGFGTGVATALGVNVGSAGAPVLFNGAGGTPSSIVLTNGTGTASGLTAGNVTTNANLTGEVTSVGNATTVTNSSVIAKLLTAFSAGAGTVSSSDTILSAFQKVVGNIALKANSASPTLTGTVDAQGTVKLSAFVTATQITANQNNYTATDGSNTCGTKTSLRISSDASRNVTGLSCSQAEGDIRIIHNVGGQNLVLTNQDTNSTAANRFLFGGDLTLLPEYSVTIKYDGVASRWRAITTAGAGGGGGGVTSVAIAPGEGVALTGTCTITTSGTCTVARADPVRQNEGLDRITQSKLTGDPRRVVNAWATGFKAATDTLRGINAGASSNYDASGAAAGGYVLPTMIATSYANTGGTGNRTASITVSSTLTTTGTLSQVVDGATAPNNSNGFFPTSSQAVSGKVIKFDFGSGNAKFIDEVKFYQQDGDANPRGVWKWQGSNDNSTWFDVGTNTNWTGGANAQFTWSLSPSTTYRYYQLLGVSGNINFYYLNEVEFKLAAAVPSADNMTLVTTSQTTDSAVSFARALIILDNTAAPTINTDLTVEITCNGGTNWAAASASSVTLYGPNGLRVVETVDQACTSGSSFAARIKTLNNKNIPIHGAHISVH